MFYRTPLYWDSPDFFLTIRLGLHDFEDHKNKMSFLAHYIESPCCQHHWYLLVLTLIICWGSFCPVSSLQSYCNPPFPYGILWKENIMPSPCFWGGGLCPTFLRAEYLHTLFGTLHWILVSPLQFVYVIISISMDSQIFMSYFWFKSILLNFVAQILPAFHWELFQKALYPFNMLSSFFFFSISLPLGSTRYPKFILYISCPSPRMNHLPHYLLLFCCIKKPRSWH